MDEQNKPRARARKIVGEGKGIEKKGEGLGTGPVNNMGNYADRKEQQGQQPMGPNGQRPVVQSQPARPAQNSGTRPQRPTQESMEQHSRPVGQAGFGQNSQRPQEFGQQSTQRPVQTPGSYQQSRPTGSANGGGNSSNGGTRATGGGGSSKLILLVVAAVVIFFFGRNLFGGNSNNGSDSTLSSVLSGQSQDSGTGSSSGQSSGLGGITNLLSSFLGSSGSSSYDFSGMLQGLTGGSDSGLSLGTGSSGSTSGSSGQSQYFTTSMENNTSKPDETVSAKARDKFTVIRGGNKDEFTIMIYMCGTDLESQSGMGTADLKEMVKAEIGEKVNLIVYTGGCSRWKNNVVSSTKNQIYQIKDGSLVRLEEDMGSGSMTSPDTLAKFIQYGSKNFAANRYALILWDHGGGSISGYGYDEKTGRGQSMTLSGINQALQSGGIQFDFIGFDACLMATVENGLMLSQYADYMIASEETEPGVGWYYTNWLTKLSKNTSMKTVEIGKMITDDFVEVCNKQCRGQATTLSVVDLAELAATVPSELKSFSIDTNELIQNKEYKKVSSARSRTQEFAQQTKIDQIDLVHFANNMGTEEGKALAKALRGAVKYNRTGGAISNAYGLSIYFPYKKTGKVNQIVSTYKAIGMDDEYTRCIQEFASLEVAGQISTGTNLQNYGNQNAGSGMIDSLLGNYAYGNSGSGMTVDSLESLLGGLFGGGSSSSGSGATGSILDLFMNRSMTAEKAADYILENHFDPSGLQWVNGRITLDEAQWSQVESVWKNLFFDDGKGFIDMGIDTLVTREGNDLVYEFSGTWLSIDRQPVAYYYLGSVEQEEYYAEIGYVPAILNGVQCRLILVFDQDNPSGYIAGAQKVYRDGETETLAKNMIDVGKGDTIQFVCDYYDYNENYLDTYKLGDPIVLGETVEIGDTYVDKSKCRVTYCLTDYYQQRYWTPAVK